MNLKITDEKKFLNFIRLRKIKLIPAKFKSEAFRVLDENGKPVAFFKFPSSDAIECYGDFGKTLIKEFYSLDVYA